MSVRSDTPLNASKQPAWTLNLAAANAVAQRPSNEAVSTDFAANAFDVRGAASVVFQIVPGTTTGTAVVELQWSLDQINFVSLGSAYQISIPAGAPSASVGLVLSPCPAFQALRVVTATAGTAGTAKVYIAMRN